MNKTLKVIASAMLITVAAASQLRAAATTNTYTNLVRNISIALTVYEQGPTNGAGPKNGTSMSIQQKKLTTGTILTDLAAATGTNFGTTPKLVQVTSYYLTNVWNFLVTSTNTAAGSHGTVLTAGVAANVYVEIPNYLGEIAVEVPYQTVNGSGNVLIERTVTNIYGSNVTTTVTTFPQTTYSDNGANFTNKTSLRMVGIITNFFTNNGARIAVLAGGAHRGANAQPFTDVSSLFFTENYLGVTLAGGTGTNLLSTNNMQHLVTENVLSFDYFYATITLMTNNPAITADVDLTSVTNNLYPLELYGMDTQTLAFESEIVKTNKVQFFNSSWPSISGYAYVGGSIILTTNVNFGTNVGTYVYVGGVGTNAAGQPVYKYLTNYSKALVSGSLNETFLENIGE